MRYLMEHYRNSALRFAGAIVLSLTLAVIALTVGPLFAPRGMGNVMPIIIFGLPAAWFTTGAVFANDGKRLERLGVIALAAFLSFWMGAVVGSDTGMDTIGSPAYGWFLGAMCAIMAISGGAIGLVFPRQKELQNLMRGRRVAANLRYYRY